MDEKTPRCPEPAAPEIGAASAAVPSPLRVAGSVERPWFHKLFGNVPRRDELVDASRWDELLGARPTSSIRT